MHKHDTIVVGLQGVAMQLLGCSWVVALWRVYENAQAWYYCCGLPGCCYAVSSAFLSGWYVKSVWKCTSMMLLCCGLPGCCYAVSSAFLSGCYVMSIWKMHQHDAIVLWVARELLCSCWDAPRWLLCEEYMKMHQHDAIVLSVARVLLWCSRWMLRWLIGCSGWPGKFKLLY